MIPELFQTTTGVAEKRGETAKAFQLCSELPFGPNFTGVRLMSMRQSKSH